MARISFSFNEQLADAMHRVGDVLGVVLIFQFDWNHYDIFLGFVNVRCSRIPGLPVNRIIILGHCNCQLNFINLNVFSSK